MNTTLNQADSLIKGADTLCPEFFYKLNNLHNNTSNVAKNAKNLYLAFRKLGKQSKKRIHIYNVITKSLNGSLESYNDDLDVDLVKPNKLLINLINRMATYEQMLSEQMSIIFDETDTQLKTQLDNIQESAKSLHNSHLNYKSSWSVQANSQNIHNLKDPNVFNKNCLKLYANKHIYETNLINHTLSLLKVNSTLKVNLMDNLNNTVLSFLSYYNNIYQFYQTVENDVNGQFKTEKSVKEAIKNRDMATNEQAEAVQQKLQKQFSSFAEEIHIVGELESFSLGQSKVGTLFTKISKVVTSNAKDFLLGPLKKDHQSSHSTAPRKNISSSNFFNSVEGGTNGGEYVDSYDLAELDRNKKLTLHNSPSQESKHSVQIFYTDDQIKTARTNLYTLQNSNLINSNILILPFSFPYSPIIEDAYSDYAKSLMADINRDPSSIMFNRTGYLKMQVKKGYFTNKYQPIYLLLSSDFGLLFGQGFNEKEPVLLAPLELTNIKTCRVSELDRNYCFKIILPNTELTMQAVNQKELDSWVTDLTKGISAGLALRKNLPNSTTRMNTVDSSNKLTASERAMHVLNESKSNNASLELDMSKIRNIKGNNVCADCRVPNPEWASINHGVVICIKCSGIHRGLGVQISKIRSLTLDILDMETFKFMLSKGNLLVNSELEANLAGNSIPTPDTSYDILKDFIIRKYQYREFVNK